MVARDSECDGGSGGRRSPPQDRVLVPLRAVFFQAGDGIRDLYVTGVQTCALPIFQLAEDDPAIEPEHIGRAQDDAGADQIGRASCRERVLILVVAVCFKKNVVSRRWLRAIPNVTVGLAVEDLHHKIEYWFPYVLFFFKQETAYEIST